MFLSVFVQVSVCVFVAFFCTLHSHLIFASPTSPVESVRRAVSERVALWRAGRRQVDQKPARHFWCCITVPAKHELREFRQRERGLNVLRPRGLPYRDVKALHPGGQASTRPA